MYKFLLFKKSYFPCYCSCTIHMEGIYLFIQLVSPANISVMQADSY
jgi:hypothetical protein